MPDEVRRALVESFFANSRTMALGAIMTTLGGVLVAYLTRAWAPAVATLMIVAVFAGRLHLVRRYRTLPHVDDSANLRWL